jgi:hypothetical protein
VPAQADASFHSLDSALRAPGDVDSALRAPGVRIAPGARTGG